jgi:hypothetical protein
MILDKNGKIGGKVSIIDIGVILIVLVVIIGIFARFGSSMTSAVQSNEKFEFTVKVTGVRQFTIDALNKKGKITDKNSEMDLGEITDVEIVPTEFQSTTASGDIVFTDLPERYTCYVTIVATGKESDDSYIMDDTSELSVGRTIDIKSKYVSTSGEIMSVKVVE